MKITIESIPHNEQRYNTVGDWQFDKEGNLNIKVSETPKIGQSGFYLIAIHELIEAVLCETRDITQDEIDDWDMTIISDTEPGDTKGCPYIFEHCTATGVERILASEFEVDWSQYEQELTELTESYDRDRNAKKD